MTLRHLALAPLLVAMLLLPSACADSSRGLAGLKAPEAASLGQEQTPVATSVATSAPVAHGEEEGASLEAQIAALAAAEGQLDQAFGRGAARELQSAKRKDLPPRDEVRNEADKPSAGRAPSPVGVSADAPGEVNLCPMACSALASMSRAVARLCGLAGEGDRRCEDGRVREQRAMQRGHASCPSCRG